MTTASPPVDHQVAEIRALYGRRVGEAGVEIRERSSRWAGAVLSRTFASPDDAKAYVEQYDREAEGFRLLATNIVGRERQVEQRPDRPRGQDQRQPPQSDHGRRGRGDRNRQQVSQPGGPCRQAVLLQ